MSLKTFVKVGRITNLSDARYCAGMGVDILGFNLDASQPGSVDPVAFQELTGWVSGVKLAGEFGELSPQAIKDLLPAYSLNFIQVSSLETLQSVYNLGVPLILKWTIHDLHDLDKLQEHITIAEDLAEFLIIDATDENVGQSLISSLTKLKTSIKILRAFGLKNVDLQEGPFDGLELLGTEEDRPGYKDYGELMDILEELEE